MNEKQSKLRAKDGLYIAMMIVPLVVAMIIKIVTTPASEGISISGARIFLEIPMPLMPLLITEAQVNSWLIMITILGVCLFLTNGIHENRGDWRQMGAEWLVEKLDGLVGENMEPVFHASYAPFVGAVMSLSVFSSLMSLFGVYPPTSDLNVVGGWAILVFILITKNKLKAGVGYYAKGYLEPIPVMLPMNIISEVATPVSMAFRHFGNVAGGGVIKASRMSGAAVGEVIKRRAAEAGLNPDLYGGHSLRAGFVTQAFKAGADSRSVRRQTGHVGDAILAVYDRENAPLEGNAVRNIGL